MKYYIFITPEGMTYQPGSDTLLPDVENCQVLGFGEGPGVTEAISTFLDNHPWLYQMSFDHVVAYELTTGKSDVQFSLADYKVDIA
jgi:hypothetical protein